ncbi:MAG: 2-dehydropantoate 2-reductase [Pseudonocardiales bacterium]|nr:2-dehydropantoate 2-reductase [Pseudonocardiales bacterium]
MNGVTVTVTVAGAGAIGGTIQVAALEHVESVGFDDVEPVLSVPRKALDWAAINASLDRLVARRRADQKTHNGIRLDLAVRHRRTEVDYQISAFAEIGAGHGLRMTLTRRVVRMIHEIEEGPRACGLASLAKLERLRSRSAMEPASTRTGSS